MSKDEIKWKVWIDQTICTGDGLCQEIAPEVFFSFDDGLYYVKQVNDKTGLDENGQPKLQMGRGLADVPDHLLDSVIEAAEECPGECIFLERCQGKEETN